MSLLEFVEHDIDAIVGEWVKFAATMLPAARVMSRQSLADHARVLLCAVVKDLRTSQDGRSRHDKSRGDTPGNAPDITSTARDHSHQRFVQGFTIDQMVSEYRALRASVIRRWTAQIGVPDHAMLDDLVRFGEAMDQALTESVA